MRPDTPLCESLRPMRRRRQLLGRYPSFHAARPQLSPPSPRADLAVDRAWTRPDGGQGGRTGKFGQLGGGAGPETLPRVCNPPPATPPRPPQERVPTPSRAARQGRQGRAPPPGGAVRGRSHWGSSPAWCLPDPIHTLSLVSLRLAPAPSLLPPSLRRRGPLRPLTLASG